MALQVFGKLTSATGDQPSFWGCLIEARFDLKPAQAPTPPSTSRPTGAEIAESTTLTPVETELHSASEIIADAIARAASGVAPVRLPVSDSSDADGNFTLVFPDLDEIASEKIKIEVHSPSGDRLEKTELVTADIGASIIIEVPKFGTTLEKPVEPTKPEARRVRGRIIERRGRQLPAMLQVLLLGRERDKPDSDPLVTILVAKADSSGYFSGAIWNLEFDRVIASITEIPGDIDVQLVDSLLPPRIPIVVELPDTPHGQSSKDCGCSAAALPRTPTQEDIAEEPGLFSADLGAGECVRFNVPNALSKSLTFILSFERLSPKLLGPLSGCSATPR
jgi:hypothetical protein